MVMLFIGHARQDSDAVMQIGAALRDQGYTVQTAAEVSVGSNWREAAENAIRAADAYVYLHSPDANTSPWLQNELLYAISQKKAIIPVVLAAASIPQPLLNYQFVDATAGVDAALQKIALAVDAVTSLPAQAIEAAKRTRELPRSATQPAAPVLAAPAPTRAARPWWLIAAGLVLLAGVALVLIFATTNQLTPSAIEHTNTSTSERTATAPPVLTLIMPGLTATFADIAPEANDEEAIEIAVARTVAAVRATEERGLSASELALVAPLTQRNETPLLLTGLIAALSLGLSGAALYVVLRTNTRHALPRRAHSPHHGQQDQAQAHTPLPAPLLADFQVFVSSSEKDRTWVERLVEDLDTMGYLVWWYAKDAPGLPFGNEIRSAIYHTKVFLIVLSPDSMQSKHVEEEIRWAEIYDRPIVPVLHRSISLDERLYGLAKGADIDFVNDGTYRESLELLAQAIDHHLQKRLAALPT